MRAERNIIIIVDRQPLGCTVADVGRLRGQPPVKPVPILAGQAVA